MRQASVLIHLSTEDAQRVKFAVGRKKYGGPFVGDPIEELYAEIIDGLNYCEEAERQGKHMGIEKTLLHRLALLTREKHLTGRNVTGNPGEECAQPGGASESNKRSSANVGSNPTGQ